MKTIREAKTALRLIKENVESKRPPLSIPHIIVEKGQTEEQAAKAAGYTMEQLDKRRHGYKMIHFYAAGERFRGRLMMLTKARYLFEGKTAKYMLECLATLKIEDVESKPAGWVKDEAMVGLILVYHRINKLPFEKCKAALQDIGLPLADMQEKDYLKLAA